MAVMNWWRNFRSWLAAFISPATQVEVVPGTECEHRAAAEVEATMHRLLAAVIDPLRFAEELAAFADCAGCSMAVLANMACTLAGIALVDGPDGDTTGYMCDHDVDPEIVALRLVLAREARDGTVLGSTLAEIDECQHCVAAVVLCLLNAHTAVLDNTGVEWAPMVQKRLESLLPPGRE